MILLQIAHFWPSTLLCVLTTTLARTKRDYQPEAIVTHHSGCHLYHLNFLVNLDFLISSNTGRPNYATQGW